MTSLKNAVPTESGVFVTTMSNLNNMRKEGTLCDVTLVVKGHHFTAHRAILAAASKFFGLMFTTAMIESTSREVNLLDVEPSTIELLLEFIYSSRISLNSSNVTPLLMASNLYQIEPVEEMCVRFLKGKIDATNCLEIFAIADYLTCRELREVAEDFILLHFTDLYKQEDFLQLHLTQIAHILQQDKLIVESEAQIYDAAMCWLKHDICNREQHMAEVLACVRFYLVSQTFLLKTIQGEPLIQDKPQCLKMIIDGMGNHQNSVQNNQPRYNRVVIAVYGGPLSLTSYHFNPKDCTWAKEGCLMGKSRDASMAVFCDNSVYIMNRKLCKGLTKCQLQPVFPPLKRDFFAACAFGEKIYTSGGAVGKLSVNQFECYDTKTKSWQVQPRMEIARHGHGSVEANGLICGGTSGNNATRRVLNDCEVYDPSAQQWRAICRMKEARMNHGLVVVSNKIYALGGKGSEGALNTVEYYDIASNKWHCASPIPCKGVSPKCAAVGRIIYVLAGEYEGVPQLKNVLEYHTHADRWVICKRTHPFPWPNCLVCVINVPQKYEDTNKKHHSFKTFI